MSSLNPTSSVASETLATQRNARQMRFKKDDLECVVAWLENRENFNSLYGTKIHRISHPKGTTLEKFAMHMNQNSQNRLKLTGKLMYHRLRHYRGQFQKAVDFKKKPGAGITEEDQSKGIRTMSQKLNSICPFFERMNELFGVKQNVTPLTTEDTCLRDKVTEIEAVVEQRSSNDGIIRVNGRGRRETEAEAEAEETIVISDTESQSTVQPSHIRRPLSSTLEESPEIGRAINKRRRINGNVVLDMGRDVILKRIAREKEMFKLTQEREERSRRIELENAHALKLFVLEEESKLKIKEMVFASQLRQKEMVIMAKLREKELVELKNANLARQIIKARCDLIIGLTAKRASLKEIKQSLKILTDNI